MRVILLVLAVAPLACGGKSADAPAAEPVVPAPEAATQAPPAPVATPDLPASRPAVNVTAGAHAQQGWLAALVAAAPVDDPEVAMALGHGLGEAANQDLGQAIGQALNEVTQAMGQGMAEALREAGAAASAQGQDPALTEAAEAMAQDMEQMGDAMAEGMEEMGAALAEGMAEGFEAMGEFLTVMMAIAPQLQALEEQHDLESPEGMRAAAGDIAAAAELIRGKIPSASPPVQKMLGELAVQIEEVAELARTDPEAAIRRRRADKAKAAAGGGAAITLPLGEQ